MDGERLAALRLAKLRALAPVEGAAESIEPFGPVLRSTEQAWAMVVDRRSLVGAAVWAHRCSLSRLDLVIDPTGGVDPATIAAGAAHFRRPEIDPWVADPHGLQPIRSAPPRRVTLPRVPDRYEPLLAVLREHGVEPVVELDAVVGEIAGLEVARLDLGADEPHLSVGVGAFDRDFNDMLAEADGVDPVARLATAARAVRQHRRVGAPPHPLNRLRRERWLRSVVVADPSLVGCDELVPLPPLPVVGLRTPAPAPALAAGDTPTLVVCSVGVDPTLVIDAAELRARHAPGARIVLVVPVGDDYPITRLQAEMVAGPVEVLPLAAPWATPR